ncbi:TetR/AcrR family transcriptional regulator [Mycobacterium sp.]|uniref:TetR/AcrR family transcriptional regulator n=1 Tax=Mycobacterium sp. TaxID=1785 RepID=UPI002DB4B5D2|nr:TetR/AcrR family transcriptional regulator [Mycobacterium sp.]
MARQARSEATRQKIIDAALELYGEIGYTATGMGDIIERAQLTKGALYYHFDSKEAVAAAVIERGSQDLLAAFRTACQSSAPAIENLIHSTFVVANVMANSRVAREAGRLTYTLGQLDESARANRDWLAAIATQLQRVAADGDLRDDVDPDVAAETLVATTTGATLMSLEASYGADLPARLLRTWRILLPALVAEHSIGYLREFVDREPLRGTESTAS